MNQDLATNTVNTLLKITISDAKSRFSIKKPVSTQLWSRSWRRKTSCWWRNAMTKWSTTSTCDTTLITNAKTYKINLESQIKNIWSCLRDLVMSWYYKIWISISNSIWEMVKSQSPPMKIMSTKGLRDELVWIWLIVNV